MNGGGEVHGWFASDLGRVVMSHHGGKPPGTLTGYQTAYDELQFRWFQLDVVPIRDDLVALHSLFGRRWGFGRLPLAAVRKRLGYDVVTLTELIQEGVMPEARWNVEVKSRSALPLLKDILRDSDAVPRVMISAPFHPSIGRELRDMFGDDLPLAAPVVEGGALNVRLRCSGVRYDCRQLYRWFVPTHPAPRPVPTIQVWGLAKPAHLDGVLARNDLHPIVASADEATRREVTRKLGGWPTAGVPDPGPPPPPPPPPPPSLPLPAPPVIEWPVELPEHVSRLFLGGGGWRGAFASIGAVMYLSNTGRWEHIDDVIAISGGSFVAGTLAATVTNDGEPGAALRDLARQVLTLRGPVRRRLLAPVALLPLLPIPGAFFSPARALLGGLWRRLMRHEFGHLVPRQPVGRRYVICAAGRDTARPYHFVAGGGAGQTGLEGVTVPGPWRMCDAIMSSTALPWVRGYRVPDSPDRAAPFCGRGEDLVDGGIAGIFGTQVFDRPPWLTSPGDGRRSLIIDAGRAHRRRGVMVEHLTNLSTIAMLARWLQISLDAGLRHAVHEADRDVPITEGVRPPRWTHLVRVAERDEADSTASRWWDPASRRLEHGRRLVNRFGLTNLNERNAHLTIVVAVAGCTLEFEGVEQLNDLDCRLQKIGAELDIGDALVSLWWEL